MIVATAGHIDHGKTTLVKALTGLDTDRLPEEKLRGISIDLGFAYWDVPNAGTVAFVDVPGHERFVRNMVAGVCGIDFVLLVIAADDGVMPQTLEHLHIVNLLGIKHGIAVITKIDYVSYERVNEVVGEVECMLKSTSLADVPVIRLSAKTGEGMEVLRNLLRAASMSQATRDLHDREFRFAIDRVFTVAGSGTIATGTVFAGSITAGDHLAIAPAGIPVRVRAIQRHGRAVPKAITGERCALNLSGIELQQLHRGDWVVAQEMAMATQQLDAHISILDSESLPLKHWTSVHVNLGAADVTARVAIRRGVAISPGNSAEARLLLDRPLAALHGDRFILRDQSATRTIGGGTVIDPLPPPSRRDTPQRRSRLAALSNDDPALVLTHLLRCSPAGIDLNWFRHSFNLTTDGLQRCVQRANAVVFANIALDASAVPRLGAFVIERLSRFHRDRPQLPGIPVEELRKGIAPEMPASTFLNALRSLGERRLFDITNAVVRLPEHIATANVQDQRLWSKVQPLLRKAGFTVPTGGDLANQVRVDKKVLRDFLLRMSKSGEVVRVGEDRFYLASTLSDLAAIAQAVAASAAHGRFTAAEYRDAARVGRNVAIEILECLDRLGVTQRTGDTRTMRKDFNRVLGQVTAGANLRALKEHHGTKAV